MRWLSALLGVALTLPAWAVPTEITAGTDLTGVLNSSGEYELQDGAHTIAANFTTAADVIVTATEGATLYINSSVIFEYRDGFELRGVQVRMANDSELKTEAESGDTHVDGAVLSGNTFMTTGTITTNPQVRISQGFATYQRNIDIEDNDFFGVEVYEEFADATHIVGNRFFDFDTDGYPIRYWGSNHYIARNFITGGQIGIGALGRHDLNAFRLPCTGNRIISNIVLNTSEEGISFDSLANNGTWTVLREYDTVATTPGSSVITLADGDWAAQTTYNSSRYDAVFTSGDLAGTRHKITTHSGASFTLSIDGGDYALIQVGDGVSVQLSCYGNTIAHNVVMPTLASHRANVSGIVLHGIGINNQIYNNVVYGETDGVGTGDNNFTYLAIREANLNSVNPASGITGNQRRGPVGPNMIVSNRSLGGGMGANYRNYGAAGDYTPPESTYTDNSELSADEITAWLALRSATTADMLRPSADSPLCAAGTYIAGARDFDDLPMGYPADICAFRCDKPGQSVDLGDWSTLWSGLMMGLAVLMGGSMLFRPWREAT